MIPYSRGLILDNNNNNYGIVKTETVFGFGPTNNQNYINDGFNSTESLEWIFSHGNFSPRSLQDSETIKDYKSSKPRENLMEPKIDNNLKKHTKNKIKRKRRGKGKKCVYKVVNKGKKNRRGNKFKAQKKYMMPVILGFLAAKSLLIPIALKALAFVSAKGLMMGFFSTVMASVLSLKGMFESSHGYQNRKDDTKTQVEIIQVPTKSEDHVYYDEHYRRGDYEPVPITT